MNQSQPNQYLIDVTEFNHFSMLKLAELFKDYLNPTVEATSINYLHTVLTIFAVETLSGMPEDLKLYTSFATGDYVQAFRDYKGQDFQSRIIPTWNEYQANVKTLVRDIIPYTQGKAYTGDFVNSNTLRISEIKIDDIKNSVVEIF